MAVARPDEFVAIYTRYERKLYRYVAALLLHPTDAEDVLQETARVLWQKFDQYRPEEPFLPWACRIAHYEVLNHCQRERTRHKHFRPQPSTCWRKRDWNTMICSRRSRGGWASACGISPTSIGN